MIDTSKLGPRGSMVERAADRVRSAYLARQRTSRVYKQHLKDLNNTTELQGDVVFDELRSNMQIAKENLESSRIAYEAIIAAPPAR